VTVAILLLAAVCVINFAAILAVAALFVRWMSDNTFTLWNAVNDDLREILGVIRKLDEIIDTDDESDAVVEFEPDFDVGRWRLTIDPDGNLKPEEPEDDE